MNKNTLKIIACLSMLADHIAVVFFSGNAVLHAIGRLAMPIFAFCIGDGVLRTKNKRKYFLRLFSLGMLCQIVYIIEEAVTTKAFNETSRYFYFNILLVFAISVALISCYLDTEKSVNENADKRIQIKKFTVFVVFLLALFGIEVISRLSVKKFGFMIYFDYGIQGMLLPLFAVIARDNGIKQKAVFTIGVIMFTVICYAKKNISIFAPLSLIFIFLYNGEKGRLNLKYLFYIFYPSHLAILYLIKLII